MRLILISSILLSMALPSSAVTLGRHGGAAVIGRPLDVRVEALTNAGEDLSNLCVSANVFFGESRLASSSVRVTPQRSAPDAKASIRVQTTVPVNEPVVALEVKAGCAAPFARRYVLLADPAPLLSTTNNNAAAPIRAIDGAPGSAGESSSLRTLPRLADANEQLSSASRGSNGSSPSTTVASNAGGDSSNANAQAPARASVKAPARKAAAPKPAPKSVVRKPKAVAESDAPRLHLDPVDLSLGIELDPVLKLSLSLLSEPTTSEEERAAAGNLWKAINATPEEILRDSQKLAVLEAESKGLREKESRDQAAIDAMQAQLDQSRNMNWLVYLLGALLLLSLLGLWFFWRRKEVPEMNQRGAEWWDGAQKPARAGAAAVAVAATAAVVERRDPIGVDIDLDIDSDSSFDDYESLHDGDSSMRAVLPSLNAQSDEPYSATSSRSVATEELFDVQQQADFFVSLGENEQAIGVLTNHLAESQEPSALAYLDLFKLYHQQDRRQDYDELREAFNHKFNAGAPPFDEYSDNSVGLEGYETAFGRIQALWPQPRVLDVIEQSIFRDPSDEDGEVFDLEAYRELLLLHAVAKEMIKRAELDEEDEHPDFEHTAIKPLKAAIGAAAAMGRKAKDKSGPNTEPLESMPVASSRLGLDVDLDALDEMYAFEASLPEVPAAVHATAAGSERLAGSVADEGNLIDFEVMDFMPPEDDSDSKKS